MTGSVRGGALNVSSQYCF